MDSRIRYLALGSEQPEKLAQFYTTYFGMRELGRSDGGDVALTDGFYNISIVKPQGGVEPGLNHFGIEIDDIREIEGRLEEFAPHADIQAENGDLFHGEYRVTDPNGLTVSLSTKHFSVPAGSRGLPAIRHVALSTPNNDTVLDFYRNVFGFREPTTSLAIREKGLATRFAADGATSLAILRYPVDQDMEEPEGGWAARHFKGGVNHFGFLVNDIQNFMAALPEGSVTKRPAVRPMTEFRVVDPEANEIDISQHKGYEIDVDVWEHA
ncbi:MAG TPA: VOC family protein [Chloroflexota bacterium]|nr:VOC family protein [Chloroflexota bacterium]